MMIEKKGKRMSDNTASPYAEITGDVQLSALQVWDKAVGLANSQNLPAPEPRQGADGLLWEGSMLSLMEEIWPELGGEARTTKEAQRARLYVHQYLTLRGLMHCDRRGGGSGGKPSVWWLRAEWDPQKLGKAALWADPADFEPEPDLPEEIAEPVDENEPRLMRQMLTIILAAQEAGAPLTTTALAQIPTGVALEYRRYLLDRLGECGAVEYRDIRVPSGHTVGVWVGASDVPSWLSVDGMPEGYSLPEEWAGQEIAAVDVMAQFVEDYRQLEESYREASAKLAGRDEREMAELVSLREQLAAIRKAVKG